MWVTLDWCGLGKASLRSNCPCDLNDSEDLGQEHCKSDSNSMPEAEIKVHKLKNGKNAQCT